MDAILQFSVNNQAMERTDEFIVVEGSENYLRAQFTFTTPDWDGLIKTAVFIDEDGDIHPSLCANDICDVPKGWLTKQRGLVSVVGSDGTTKITTKAVKINIREKGYTSHGQEEEEEFKPYFDQLMEKLKEKADSMKYENNILKLLSGETEISRVIITGGSGSSREIELQKGETAIQWRYVGDEIWMDLVSLADLKGDTGADGLPGADGQPGSDGITPHIGDNGNWYTGDTDTGKPSRGEPGADGQDGAPGTNGKDGQDGADGRGITSVTITAEGHLQINYSDNTNADAGKVVGEDGMDGASGIQVRQEMAMENTASELRPNILYVFPEMSELAITLATPTDTSVASEYHWIFQSGETATTLTIPDTINVPDGFSVEVNKVYELSVMENCLTYQSWDYTAEVTTT